MFSRPRNCTSPPTASTSAAAAAATPDHRTPPGTATRHGSSGHRKGQLASMTHIATKTTAKIAVFVGSTRPAFLSAS